LTPATRFRARPGVVLSGKGDARFLTDLSSGQVYELNETAAAVFEVARLGAGEAEVAAALAAKYPEVPSDELGRDAREVLADMVRAGVLEHA
jgi:coenzyme PQQ synthesis protein D (PqqD)